MTPEELVKEWELVAVRKRQQSKACDALGRHMDANLYDMAADVWAATAKQLREVLGSQESVDKRVENSRRIADLMLQEREFFAKQIRDIRGVLMREHPFS